MSKRVFVFQNLFNILFFLSLGLNQFCAFDDFNNSKYNKACCNTVLNYKIPEKLLEYVEIAHSNMRIGMNEAKIYNYYDYIFALKNNNKDFIYELFKKTKKELSAEFEMLEPLNIFSIDEINELYVLLFSKNNNATFLSKRSKNKKNFSSKNYSIKFRRNFDVKNLKVRSKDINILQIASQANFLESMGNYYMPIEEYPYDKTQGPIAVLSALTALLYRDSQVASGKLRHSFQFLPDKSNSYYKNGYLELFKIKAEEKVEIFNYIKSNINKMEILVQPVLLEHNKQFIYQAFTSAVSFQGYTKPVGGSLEEELASLILVAQYEALLKYAVLLAVEEKKDVTCYLTKVGTGAFNNNIITIEKAIAKVTEILEEANFLLKINKVKITVFWNSK